MSELFDPMPYISVLEETDHYPTLRLSLVVTLSGPANTVDAEWSVCDPVSGDWLWDEHSVGHALTAGSDLLVSALRRALDRAQRQLSPF